MSNKQHILEINIFQRVHSADIMCSGQKSLTSVKVLLLLLPVTAYWITSRVFQS